MVLAKNYETVSTFVEVMQNKPWPLFPDTVYIRSCIRIVHRTWKCKMSCWRRCTGSRSECDVGRRSSCGHDGRHDHTTVGSSADRLTGCNTVGYWISIRHGTTRSGEWVGSFHGTGWIGSGLDFSLRIRSGRFQLCGSPWMILYRMLR